MADVLEQYWQGTRVQLRNRITDRAGAPVTNATAAVTLTWGDGTRTGPLVAVYDSALVGSGGEAGWYFVEVTLNTPGVLVHDWVSTAPLIVATEARLYVRPRRDLA